MDTCECLSKYDIHHNVAAVYICDGFLTIGLLFLRLHQLSRICVPHPQLELFFT